VRFERTSHELSRLQFSLVFAGGRNKFPPEKIFSETPFSVQKWLSTENINAKLKPATKRLPEGHYTNV
jgi:hypothetical protein